MTIIAATNRRVRIVEISVAGRGITSAAQQLFVANGSGGTTGGGAISAVAFDHAEQPTAASTVNTTWSSQPTLSASGEVIGWNALGGANRWIPPGGGALQARNGAYISVRAPSGPTYQSMSINVVIEED
jgi:hypothetical protein